MSLNDLVEIKDKVVCSKVLANIDGLTLGQVVFEALGKSGNKDILVSLAIIKSLNLIFFFPS